MKTRTNQPVFFDNGERVDDSKVGGTKLYKHKIMTTYVSGTMPTRPVTIISFDPQPYDEEIDILLGENALSIVDDDGFVYSYISYYGGECEHRKLNAEDSLTFTYTDFSDTVTPL